MIDNFAGDGAMMEVSIERTEDETMKTKLILALLAAALPLALAACGNGSSDKPVIHETEALAETADTSGQDEPAAADEAEDESESYSNVVYSVGDDIPAGGYVVTCTGTDSVLEVTVFAGEESYDGFQGADKFTVGDYSSAVEQYAWANFFLDEGEAAYVGLREGYIILLDAGKCEFTKYDPAAAQTIYPGIYVVGEDLSPEKVNIKCTSEYMQVTQFASKDDYLGYHKTSRFTVGEESDAIEKYAASTDFIYADESTYANLQDGMVIMVEEGSGEYSAAEGPVIH